MRTCYATLTAAPTSRLRNETLESHDHRHRLGCREAQSIMGRGGQSVHFKHLQREEVVPESSSTPPAPAPCGGHGPGLSVRAETLAAAVAPPAGGAGVVGGAATDAAEVPRGKRGRRRRCGQVVGLRPLGQVLPRREQEGESDGAGEHRRRSEAADAPPPPTAR